MNLREVIEEVPGLNRRFVYYLESRGLVGPTKIPKQRIARRDYSQEDLRTIKETWKYYQRGFALPAAYHKATKEDRCVAYVVIQVPHEQRSRVLELLRQHSEVTEACAVYGGQEEIILRIETPDESDVYYTLVPSLSREGIPGLQSISQAREYFRRESGLAGEEKPVAMMAYVLMKVPGKDVGEVMERLRAFEAVKEASTIYGESDIIAKVRVADQGELDKLVMEEFHGIPAVESTRTFIAIGNLHWER
ncbi:MAG: Lrp/AsnC ligand binding domain-containing protein [Chloroflexi bacterium]|nr:Lrp/AsnC ligand binding domain-containing protein [Chloroflexota bacterium]